jgi:hypothetical protein
LKANLIETIKNRDTDVVVTIGAGDIDTYILDIKAVLS